MSMFNPVRLACPHCGKQVDFEASASVNADRRPDLRQAILDGTFQRKDCPHCGQSIRLDPQANYLDIGRGQWFAAFPRAWIDHWDELEAGARKSFDSAFGADAGDAAHEVGAGLKPRMVFGWEGLREKLVAADAGLDDGWLECTKLALMRGLDDPLPAGQALRLHAVEPGDDESELVFVTVEEADVRPEELRVPRGLYDDIQAEAADWQPLKSRIEGGLFVDVQRLIKGAEDAAEG
jgi:endogenous inhibitor of DNA gyrase (YacG/DUF329 family)